MRRVVSALFRAPEPSWQGFVGYVGFAGLVAALFAGYYGAWAVVVLGMAVAIGGIGMAVWLQGRRQRTGPPHVEPPSIHVHYVYPWPIVGLAAVGAGAVVGDIVLAAIGAAAVSVSSFLLWLAWRRRRHWGERGVS